MKMLYTPAALDYSIIVTSWNSLCRIFLKLYNNNNKNSRSRHKHKKHSKSTTKDDSDKFI